MSSYIAECSFKSERNSDTNTYNIKDKIQHNKKKIELYRRKCFIFLVSSWKIFQTHLDVPRKRMNFNARKAYISLSFSYFIGVEVIGPAVTVSASTIPFELAWNSQVSRQEKTALGEGRVAEGAPSEGDSSTVNNWTVAAKLRDLRRPL